MNRFSRSVLRGWAWVWALPATSIGLLVAGLSLASRGRVGWMAGTIEVCGGRAVIALLRRLPVRGGADAVTLGHVIVGRSAESLRRHHEHERVHVRQFERWGLFLFPAYAAASLWAWWRGRDPYLENVFEREAAACAEPPATPTSAARTRSSRTPAARWAPNDR